MGATLGFEESAYFILCFETYDVAKVWIRYSQGDNVDLRIKGAATHGLRTEKLTATITKSVHGC